MFTHWHCRKRLKSVAGNLEHSTEEMEGRKVEPRQTDFTDDVICKSNAANEGTYGEKKEGEKKE